MSTVATARGRTGVSVRLGQMVASADPGQSLVAVGLGSCIGLVLVDPVARIAGMAHVMLPSSDISETRLPPGKYADTAVPSLTASLAEMGASLARLVATIAGGAQMFASGSGGGALNIGVRNAMAVRAALQAAGLRLRAADTGGNAGRTVELAVGTGIITVRTVGGVAREL